MRLTFRAKLLIIVATSAIAFALLMATGAFLTNRTVRQLEKIREHYIPIIELRPLLEADFEHISRGFQDSVAAQDIDALNRTRAIKDGFLARLTSMDGIIDPGHAAELRERMEDYYASGYEVSRRLISGETGEALVNAMTLMQEKQAKVSNVLKQVIALDRKKLIETFSTIADTQKTNGRLLILISVSCLIVVSLLSLALSRSVFRSLSALSAGLSRFGRGDFSEPISITERDELGDLAQEANQMAFRIKSLVKELDSFSYSVAHDLRAPLRGIMGFSTVLLEDFGTTLSPEAKEPLMRVISSAKRMGLLIDSLLSFSKLARKDLKKESVDLSALAQGIVSDLRQGNPERNVSIKIEDGLVVNGDSQLLYIALMNLLGNAWKFTAKKDEARIEFGIERQRQGNVYFIRDNGAGFDMQYAGKLFGAFQRLHTLEEFDGTGIGLATVQSIINRHGGRIWAESKPGEGARFYFTV